MVLLLLAEDEPPHSKGLTPVHAICMKLSDNRGGSEHAWCILNTNAQEEYQLDVEHLADHLGLVEVFPGD